MLGISLEESIYFDMYKWGLGQIPLEEIESECRMVGKLIRQKDYDNYYRGYYKSHKRDPKNILKIGTQVQDNDKLLVNLNEWPENPLDFEIEQRWVPCSSQNKPLIQWGSGCLERADAEAYPRSVYLAENLRDTHYVVIDCDGDHNDSELDFETVFFLYQFTSMTDTREKPKLIQEYEGYEPTRCTLPASFHLTFRTDRLIPTIHCPWAHIDILGNQRNQLRYLKNKVWNGLEPAELTKEIWCELTDYVLKRRGDKSWA